MSILTIGFAMVFGAFMATMWQRLSPRHRLLVLLVAALALMLLACGGNDAGQAAPEPEPTPAVTLGDVADEIGNIVDAVTGADNGADAAWRILGDD